MKSRITLIYLSILISLLIPVELKDHRTHDGDGSPINIASHVEALQPLQKSELVLLATKTVEPVKQEPVASPIVSNAPVSSNAAKAFIYQHESGNNVSAVNSIGCRGLGQACPGSKLPCGADYACQDAYFTNYAMVVGLLHGSLY